VTTIAKACSKCHEVKPVAAFGPNSRARDGLRSACNPCRRPEGVRRAASGRAVFDGMHARCEKSNATDYADYGGRGISVCDRWSGPDGFEHWRADVGPRPPGVYPSGHPRYSLDRIDNGGNYEPGNCRWATQSEQVANRRTLRGLEARIAELEAQLAEALTRNNSIAVPS
jgi:hypothetical protein